MKTTPDSHALVADVLGESPDGFREAMLATALGHAKSRRVARIRGRRLAAASAVLALLLSAVVASHRPAPATRPRSFAIVRTTPASHLFVHAEPVFARIATDPRATHAGLVAVAPPRYRTVSDPELLALFPGRSVGLVAGPDGHRRLVFLDGDPPAE